MAETPPDSGDLYSPPVRRKERNQPTIFISQDLESDLTGFESEQA